MRTSMRSWWPWIVCGLAAVFYCYEYLLRVSPSVMLPELMRSFGISAATLGVLSSFYYYAYTPMQLPVGVMMDRFGPRKILTLAVASCAIGAFVFGQTHNFWMAAAGRALMGFGSAFAFVGVLKLATIWLPPNRFAFIAGLATTLGMIGAISGELILSRMVSLVGWENTVWYSGVCGLVLLPLVWWIVRDTVSPEEPFIPPETHFLADSWAVIRNGQVWIAGMVGGLLFALITVFAELWGNEYLKAVYNISVEQASWGTSLVFAGWAVGGPIMGAWSDRIKSRKIPLLVGSVSCCAVLSWMMFVPVTISVAYLCLFLSGFFCSVQVIVFAVGRENCPISLAGTAAATTNFLIMLVGAILQPLAGKIIDITWSGEMVQGQLAYGPENYQMAMLMVPIALLLAFFLLFFLKETHCHQPE